MRSYRALLRLSSLIHQSSPSTPSIVSAKRSYSTSVSLDDLAPSAQPQVSLNQSNSIEDYLAQMTTSPSLGSNSIIPSPSTEPSQQDLFRIPATPAWAMRRHPELFDPPILKPTHRIHVATLVIEAYNPEADQLPLVAGFALQAAYHLGIPVTKPASMPIKTELHTVLRSGFVHKKSQENFWRLTHRRVIKAYDSNEEVINRWINYLRNEAVRGTNVALKAQRFLYRPIGWGQQIDQLLKRENQLEQIEKSNLKTQAKKNIKSQSLIQNNQPSASSSSSTSSITLDKISPADAIRQLAEKLIKEELKPKADEQDKINSKERQITQKENPMAELEVTEAKT
ncbi:hypothetical protein O181_058445 [Austropuccinia psidii MF-1]|uniref:Small ribosomal subunit protein uS10 domain-containing protein n=1 Tax=Austropuccinia psidii MF-1 TaxID=1389203 RepID=A0A9Q3E9P8_9BASI|nr:hypothetical protein [Austropuccinia psidii MF-1]